MTLMMLHNLDFAGGDGAGGGGTPAGTLEGIRHRRRNRLRVWWITFFATWYYWF